MFILKRCAAIVIAGVVLYGCDALSPSGADGFEVVKLENPSESEWQTANLFASAETGLDVKSVEDVTDLLRSLEAKGYQVRTAWFRKGSPSCGQLTVVVPDQLLVEISANDDLVLPAGPFERVKDKPSLFCPNEVFKIQPG